MKKKKMKKKKMKKKEHPAYCIGRGCRCSAPPAQPERAGDPDVHVLKLQRIGDKERDACLARLHQAYGAGRLDRAELDARTVTALTARTAQELGFLLQDLAAAPGSTVSAGKRDQAFTILDVLVYSAGTVASALGLAAGDGHSPVFTWMTAVCVITAPLFFFLAVAALAEVIIQGSRSA